MLKKKCKDFVCPYWIGSTNSCSHRRHNGSKIKKLGVCIFDDSTKCPLRILNNDNIVDDN